MLNHDRQWFNTLIPPSHESAAVTVDGISRLSGSVRLILRYTMPDIHCRDRRYEWDGGIRCCLLEGRGRIQSDVYKVGACPNYVRLSWPQCPNFSCMDILCRHILKLVTPTRPPSRSLASQTASLQSLWLASRLKPCLSTTGGWWRLATAYEYKQVNKPQQISTDTSIYLICQIQHRNQ